MQTDLAEGTTAGHPSPRDRKIRDRSAMTALLLGLGFLWPIPVGGALLMVAGALGLAISWEDGLVEARVEPRTPRADR
jgi:hypothetical protein